VREQAIGCRVALGFVEEQHSEPARLLGVHLSSEGLGREDASYQAIAIARPATGRP
jgi:hypothetical protein